MHSEDNTLILKPSLLYVFSKYGWMAVCSIIAFIGMLVVKSFYSYLLSGGASIIFLCLFGYAGLQLLLTSWTVTSSQIIYKRGVIATQYDYLELYRVNDYSSERSVIDALIGLKKVYIHTTDHSHPLLVLYGIPNDIDVINIIRNNVEQTKTKRNIYEIANR